MNISDLVIEAHAASRAKGWWGDGETGELPEDVRTINHERVASKLALVHSEVSEALECVRDGQYSAFENPERPGKPEGLPSELADVVIRVADLAGALGIDLDASVRSKLDYNRTRQHRHGGRLL